MNFFELTSSKKAFVKGYQWQCLKNAHHVLRYYLLNQARQQSFFSWHWIQFWWHFFCQQKIASQRSLTLKRPNYIRHFILVRCLPNLLRRSYKECLFFTATKPVHSRHFQQIINAFLSRCCPLCNSMMQLELQLCFCICIRRSIQSKSCSAAFVFQMTLIENDVIGCLPFGYAICLPSCNHWSVVFNLLWATAYASFYSTSLYRVVPS